MTNPRPASQSGTALLVLDFVIIGGGVSGLTAAIGLARAGHRVTLLEQADDFQETSMAGGCRLAPNMSRIFFRWGLEKQLREIAYLQQYVCFMRCDTGEVVSQGEWVPDFKLESGGVFFGMHYADFRRMLYETAVQDGANIRCNARVVAADISEERPTVTLEGGEKIVADVVVGADGVNSVSRALMTEDDEARPTGMMMYNVQIPMDRMASEPELAEFLPKEGLATAWSWAGHSCGAMGFATKRNDFHLHVYAPRKETDAVAGPAMTFDNAELLDIMKAEGCEPRLIKMASMSTKVVLTPIVEKAEIEDWVHDCGRYVVIGEAAHPLTTGSLYAVSIAAGDGIMLGRLFRYLHRRAQIAGFLAACAENRQRRVQAVHRAQRTNPAAMAMPPGILQARRLKDVVEKMGNEAAAWYTEEAIRDIFAFDPEDEADDWWVHWGLVQERSERMLPEAIVSL